jgi:hypothetical protein
MWERGRVNIFAGKSLAVPVGCEGLAVEAEGLLDGEWVFADGVEAFWPGAAMAIRVNVFRTSSADWPEYSART